MEALRVKGSRPRDRDRGHWEEARAIFEFALMNVGLRIKRCDTTSRSNESVRVDGNNYRICSVLSCLALGAKT